jgi:hypothetical protein
MGIRVISGARNRIITRRLRDAYRKDKKDSFGEGVWVYR